MIDVRSVLRDVPHFDKFCSVDELQKLVERMRSDKRFEVRVAGTSSGGVPIHHLQIGSGSVKALVVAGPHAPEAIGGLVVFSLLTLLYDKNHELSHADVEWHVIPCIDPDGAILNEGWTQGPLSIEKWMRHFYLQEAQDGVDTSFPVKYKKLNLENAPSREALVLQRTLDEVRPDFYFSLHNAMFGGAWFLVNRSLGDSAHQEIYELLDHLRYPLQERPFWGDVCAEFGQGFVEMFSVRKYYDYLARSTSNPERLIHFGASSFDYLEEIRPEALIFVAEPGYMGHPSNDSTRETGESLRRFKLRMEAEGKYLVTVLLEEWEKVKDEVDQESPFYRVITRGNTILPSKDTLCEGGGAKHQTSDILFNPEFGRMMTERDLFNTCVEDGVMWLLARYQMVRLLKASRQTEAIKAAIARLDRTFDEALGEIGRHIDFDAFEPYDCNVLFQVQFGTGLIALNSVIKQRLERVKTAA
jgi:hypothetical protein